MNREKLETLFVAFDDEIESALADHRSRNGGPRGMSVECCSDFAYVQISALKRMKWWSRAFMDALEGKNHG